MSLKHVEEVIKAAGLPAEEVKKLVDLPDDAADFKPDTHVTALRDNVATGLKNDPKFYEGLNLENLPKEVTKALEQAQYGRAAAIARTNLLKASGLTEKDFADLGEDAKKLEVFTPALMKKFSEGKITDKQLQEALQAANTELEELKGNAPKLEEKYKGEYEKKIQAYEVRTGVLSAIAAVPGLKVSPKLVLSDTLEQLRSQYHLALVNGDVVLRQLEKPELKVLTANNTKELTLADALTELLTKENAIDVEAAKKKTQQQTSSTTVESDKKGGLKLGHTNDKVQKMLDSENKAKK